MQLRTQISEVSDIAGCEFEVSFECRRGDKCIERVGRATQRSGRGADASSTLGNGGVDRDDAIGKPLGELTQPRRQLGAPHGIRRAVNAVGHFVQRDDGKMQTARALEEVDNLGRRPRLAISEITFVSTSQSVTRPHPQRDRPGAYPSASEAPGARRAACS